MQNVGQCSSLLCEGQRHGVQTVTLARRRRTIRKYVSEVTAAARADLLDAYHAVARVADAFDVRFVEGLEEARPARARIELSVPC
jgi:hypothetical protein